MQQLNKLPLSICASLNGLLLKRRLSSVLNASNVKPSYLSRPGKEPLLDWTVGDCVNNAAKRFPRDLAVIVREQNISKSFAEVKEDIDQLASSFIALGLKRGERLGLWSLNRYEWILTQYATAKTGLILVCINPGYKLQELYYCLNKVGVSTLVTCEGVREVRYYELLSKLLLSLNDSAKGCLHDEKIPTLKNIIMFTENDYRGIYKFSDVFKMGKESHMQKLLEIEEKIQFDDPVKIMFTSGTMGNPKAVVLSHHGVVNNNYCVGKRLGLDLTRPVTCVPSPLYHAFACCVGSLLGMIHGVPMIYPSSLFSPSTTINTIMEQNVTMIYGSPSTYIDLMRKVKQDKLQISLQFGLIGAAPCSSELFLEIQHKLNIDTLLNVYGSSATSPVCILSSPSDSLEVRSKYLGYPMEHVEIKITNRNGQTVPLGTAGELWTRGYHVMLGYWNDEEKTADIITKDGWYKTGDLLALHENGYLTILGRTTEMLIRGGDKIYPFDIEEFLKTHPKIADAYVIGVPDERLGEEICACILIKPNSIMSKDEVIKYCKDQIGHSKVPKYVVFIRNVPRTFTGKVQKSQLRENAIQILQIDIKQDY